MTRKALLIFLAILTACATAVAQSEMQNLLDLHNASRAGHCVPPLSWSSAVAAKAQEWADRCVFDHDPNSELGENLAWGTQLSASETFDLWYSEIGEYNYARPGFGPAGHFTQVVWRGSRQLGCGRAVCRGEIYWVCRYSPPGNVDGAFRANVQPVCR
jgi:uncharacterized protein YkwD